MRGVRNLGARAVSVTRVRPSGRRRSATCTRRRWAVAVAAKRPEPVRLSVIRRGMRSPLGRSSSPRPRRSNSNRFNVKVAPGSVRFAGTPIWVTNRARPFTAGRRAIRDRPSTTGVREPTRAWEAVLGAFWTRYTGVPEWLGKFHVLAPMLVLGSTPAEQLPNIHLVDVSPGT